MGFERWITSANPTPQKTIPQFSKILGMRFGTAMTGMGPADADSGNESKNCCRRLLRWLVGVPSVRVVLKNGRSPSRHRGYRKWSNDFDGLGGTATLVIASFGCFLSHRGTPKSSILMGFSMKWSVQRAWGTPMAMETPMCWLVHHDGKPGNVPAGMSAMENIIKGEYSDIKLMELEMVSYMDQK